MKKIILLFIMTLVVFTGCNEKKENIENANSENTATVENKEEANSKKMIYVSNYPLYDLTKSLVGDKVELVNITSNSGFHGWEPTAKDIANIKESDLFIYNGHGLENWVDTLIENGTFDGNILEVSNGLALLESTHDHDHEHEHDHENEVEDHDHDHEAEAHDHDREEAAENHEHEHNHGKYDPHIWLSLRNAEKILENIKNKLVELDSENKDFYEENYNKTVADLKNLDEKYVSALSETKRDTIVVSHEAYGYLCRDYGFKQVGIEGINAEGEPSLQQIDNIIKTAKQHDVKVIFYEDTISPKVAELIANEVGAELLLLSPIEALSEEQIAKGENYLSIMEQNLEGINKALNE